MNNKTKVDELFLQNEHLLTEKPSANIWERLESRLDALEQEQPATAKVRSLTAWKRYGAVAAAVALIVVAVTVVTKNRQQDSFFAEAAWAEHSLADLAIEENPHYMKRVAYQLEYIKLANR